MKLEDLWMYNAGKLTRFFFIEKEMYIVKDLTTLNDG